MPVNQVKLF